jgi:hypothetical protein
MIEVMWNKWLQCGSMFMKKKKGSELWTKFVFMLKFEGLNPFYSPVPLLKVSRYISYRVYGIVIHNGSAKGCIVPALILISKQVIRSVPYTWTLYCLVRMQSVKPLQKVYSITFSMKIWYNAIKVYNEKQDIPCKQS